MGIAISKEFSKALNKLPESLRKRTSDFYAKFIDNPHAPGFNYEPIIGAVDRTIHSARLNDSYRIIIKREDETDTYILLWIGQHDEAYEWALSRKCEINTKTGKIQIINVDNPPLIEDGEPNAVIELNHLFDNCTDEQLLQMGVPLCNLKLVRDIKNYRHFCNCKYLLPDDIAESLEYVANGFPPEEVLDMLRESMTGSECGTFAEALVNGKNDDAFYIVKNQEELQKVIEAPLETWRIFLHSTQRDIVNRDYSGPARVLDEAGTGKTVVAMHRAKRLASNLEDGQKILFTTFSTNLAKDIEQNLKKICSEEELSHIEVKNLDLWLAQFLKEKNVTIPIIRNQADDYWEQVMTQLNIPYFEKAFYKEEWSEVIAPYEILTLDEYLAVPRRGREKRLDLDDRKQAWPVFEAFMTKLKNKHVMDIETAINLCKSMIREQPISNVYPSIIVDEAQDFSPNALSLIRTIGGQEHQNDIFIVGDAHQRIYGRETVLSHYGINIKGRGCYLKINYRTTEETQRFASSILKDYKFDDLDGNIAEDTRCISFTHGAKPVMRCFHIFQEEVDFISNEVSRLLSEGVSAREICIVARINRMLDSYVLALRNRGIKTYEVKNHIHDDDHYDGIRVATMHRIKGLEFKYVFLASMNEGIVPPFGSAEHLQQTGKNEILKTEKCLIYVALTRAQIGTYITSYGNKSELLRWNGIPLDW